MTVPTPPATAAPPMNTAAMASSSQPMPSWGPAALRQADEDHAGERGSRTDMFIMTRKLTRLVLTPDSSRRAGVAADRVDVAAEDGVAGDEAVQRRPARRG